MSVSSDQLELGARWLDEGRRVVCSLLVEVVGSAPFSSGAFMLVDRDGAIEGSITGGCVESDVVAVALEILATAGPPRLKRYGVSDAQAQELGLACGGTVAVFVHELRGGARDACHAAFAAVSSGRAAAVATLLDGEHAGAKLALVDHALLGGFPGRLAALQAAVVRDLEALGERAADGVRGYGVSGELLADELRVHLHAYSPPPTLLLVGAIDYSAAVARLAAQLGYRVVISEARSAFARSERFANVAQVRLGWPAEAVSECDLTERDALIVFSHDPRFDEPAIIAALATEVGYIGALGSRRTAAERRRRLLVAGADPRQLGRVHAPCGLDIGAVTPEEVAVSILGEVIAARSAREARSLRDARGPIRPH
jgi:xanthine dehydrogenase accessory factor